MQKQAIDSVNAAKEDVIPDADQVLLQLLTEEVGNGNRPTPSELLNAAQKVDEATFDSWSPRMVSNRLKTYGIALRKLKPHEYRETILAQLWQIQQHYGLDLGITAANDKPDAPLGSQSSHASRLGDAAG
jgi:hypothetical protein